ncbi:DNA processing protein [Actinoplanes lutulentus]|uniref:DNA processing protein n=1 Tax=Actinoplanes lutulentus TaxID=1287878 RepID=A0A327Z387_9ACTN|nr:DNA-processing protein DprA [Actinoplanes lutulentus]MBB2940533.1 DNA processing protein [Actinoplanes lutulentus]RAK24803.1 DNA processing protein [Actinoplanes lutulentus]
MTTGLEENQIARAVLAYLAVHLPTHVEQLHELAVSLGPVEALGTLLSPATSADVREHYLGVMPVERLRVHAGAVLDAAEDAGTRVLVPEDKDWPARLDDLSRIEWAAAPSSAWCLWVRGVPAPIPARTVAIHGSRAATPYGNTVATELGHDLAKAGWTVAVTSNFGINAAALRGALAADGRVVAVLPGGIDRPYPAGHRALLGQAAKNGQVISAYPPGTPPDAKRAAAADRLLAGLTSGAVLVEAPPDTTVVAVIEETIRRGRRAMVVPGPVTSVLSGGPHQALRDHRQARLVRDAADVLTELKHTPAGRPAAH